MPGWVSLVMVVVVLVEERLEHPLGGDAAGEMESETALRELLRSDAVHG